MGWDLSPRLGTSPVPQYICENQAWYSRFLPLFFLLVRSKMLNSHWRAVRELLVGSTHVIDGTVVKTLFLVALKANIFPKHSAHRSRLCRNALAGLVWELSVCHIWGYVCRRTVRKIDPSWQWNIPKAWIWDAVNGKVWGAICRGRTHLSLGHSIKNSADLSTYTGW